ncbi:MAG: hypothetical protein J7501_05575 [Bdellovibrio sp.]|nr:hypothetical protein [Bdellovibrio sp.]
MKSLWITLVTLLAVMMFHRAYAQESAPQEPPFVQESEFDSSAKDPVDQELDDVLKIEDEIKQSAKPPAATPAPAPQAPVENNTVDLNKQQAEKAIPEEDLILPDEQQAEIPAPPPMDIPVEEAPVEVKAADIHEPSEVVRKTARGGVEYIRHPQAAQGLLRIEKDGTYVYRTTEPKGYTTSGNVRIGAMDAPIITSSDGVTNFEMMYDGPTVPYLSFDYEWKPFENHRNFAIQLGLGLMTASGSGRFTKSAPNGGAPQAGDVAPEQYTIAAIPLNAGLSYRFQFADRQIVAPYVVGGGSYIGMVEYRDDGNSTNAVGTPAAYGGGGLLLNVGAMSHDTAFTLRNEYGIANLWVILDYRYLKSFSDDIDFSSNIISAGVAVDY